MLKFESMNQQLLTIHQGI